MWYALRRRYAAHACKRLRALKRLPHSWFRSLPPQELAQATRTRVESGGSRAILHSASWHLGVPRLRHRVVQGYTEDMLLNAHPILPQLSKPARPPANVLTLHPTTSPAPRSDAGGLQRRAAAVLGAAGGALAGSPAGRHRSRAGGAEAGGADLPAPGGRLTYGLVVLRATSFRHSPGIVSVRSWVSGLGVRHRRAVREAGGAASGGAGLWLGRWQAACA